MWEARSRREREYSRQLRMLLGLVGVKRERGEGIRDEEYVGERRIGEEKEKKLKCWWTTTRSKGFSAAGVGF